MPRKPPAPTTSTPANNAYMQHSSYHAHGSHLSYLILAGTAHKTTAARLHKAKGRASHLCVTSRLAA